MKHVILYARVSTTTQKNNETIDTQVKTLTAYCKKHGMHIVDTYKDDGVSGASEDRVVNFVEYLKIVNADAVVFTYFDRLARDTFLQLWFEKECKKLDLELIATEQDLFNHTGSDPLQQAMKEMMYVFAKLEKNIIAKRLAGGRQHKATTKGIKSQGNCPLGYRYAGESTKDKHVIIDEREATIVKAIFDTFQDTRSTTRTAKAINAKGYVNKRGAAFTKQGIQLILQNNFYTGKIEYNGETVGGKHPAIISKHQFTKVQHLFARGKIIP